MTDSNASSTTPERQGNGEATTPQGGEKSARGRTRGSFTPESARKAAQARADKARERNALRAEETRLGHLTARQRLGLSLAKLSQDDMDAVVAALAQRAKQGEHQAVNALARLLDQSFGRSGLEAPADPRPTTERPWEEWTEAERAQYREALLAQREREDAERQAAGDSSDPRLADGSS